MLDSRLVAFSTLLRGDEDLRAEQARGAARFPTRSKERALRWLRQGLSLLLKEDLFAIDSSGVLGRVSGNDRDSGCCAGLGVIFADWFAASVEQLCFAV